MSRHITEYTLYRWRYSIGYVLVGLLVSVVLVAAVFYVPGGLSMGEMSSAVKSNSLSFTTFDPSSVVDLPYKVLQQLSFLLFGITTFSIKLPSLFLALLSLLGIILLLRHWFHTNVAVISALIIITSSQFIFASQDGTPTIMYIFLPTWLLFLALTISRQKQNKRRIWEILLVTLIALSLYTPLSVYIVIAILSATVLHPHLRYIVGTLSRKKLIISGIVGLIVTLPLIAAVVMQPKVGLTLLGIPAEWPSILGNLRTLLDTHLGFILSKEKGQMQSVYTLPSLLLMLLGVLHLFRTRHTARSYIIASWFILLTPIILLNPEKTAITFAPVMLLIAAGIDELLLTWYRMFPRNPYARVAGLFPITLLVVGMALTGIERYFYTFRYSPDVAVQFSNDLGLLSKEIAASGNEPVVLLTAQAELPFYEAVADHNKALRIIPPDQAIPTDEQFIITRGGFYERNMAEREPAKIITNGKSNLADRLYLYKTTEK